MFGLNKNESKKKRLPKGSRFYLNKVLRFSFDHQVLN